MDVNTCTKLFAHDTSLYVIIDTPDITALALNRDTKKIYQWATRWFVLFNPK